MNSRLPADTSILIVEDDDLIREALHEFVSAAFPECSVLRARTTHGASAIAKSHSPDVIVVDVALPRHDDLAIIRQLTLAAPEAHIVALTRRDEACFREMVCSAGASACMLVWNVCDDLSRVLKELLAPNGRKKESRTIVYVEDDPEMIDLVKLILNRHSFNAVGALGGREALKTIRDIKPDLVLLDLMMPDVNGWDVYQQMKAEADTKDIPVIVVTVLDPYWSQKRGVAPLDVDGYLVKPFLPSALVNEVGRTLQG